ncbi:uncharacterized protein si:ch211-130h14.4 [Clinocottus analis]|uniref:uncharacterized protein si:ch211-130h14.4 n=1 Tax=Clinocottus analis TaxID=304258 RepID=UPI0035BF5B10
MRSECRDLHRSSTLDAHLSPVGVRKAGDEVKTEPRRRKALRNNGPDLDQEAKARSQAQLDQRHLEAYRNIHRLRDALCRRYAALLKNKVHGQRVWLQQSAETARAKSQREAKQKQKKLAFSKLQHNDSYLKALPKTSYYLIFDLQKQLSERGHLKSHHDVEDFYSCIRYNCQPSQLYKSLEDVRKRRLLSRPAADLTTQHKTSEKHLCTAEDRAEEDQSRLLQQVSGLEEIFGGSQRKNEIEQMFPKMKAPTFATLQPHFMRSFQSSMPDLIIPEIPETSRKAEIYLRRLRRMHDLCLTNMACSKRLPDRETDSLSWQEERGNQDLMLPVIDSTQRKTSQTNRPPLCSQKQPRGVGDDGPSCPQQPSRMTLARVGVLGRHQTLVWDTASWGRKAPDPLSIEDVCQQKHVKIIDCGIKLWKNYM